MSGVMAYAADVRPPVEAKCLRAAVAVASAVLDISSLIGNFITVQNSGAFPIYVVFGDALSVAAPGAASGVTACLMIAAGDRADYRYPVGYGFLRAGAPAPIAVTHVAHISVGGASEIRVAAS